MRDDTLEKSENEEAAGVGTSGFNGIVWNWTERERRPDASEDGPNELDRQGGGFGSPWLRRHSR